MCFITYFKQTRTYCRRLNRYFHFVYVQRGRINESYFALFFLFPLKVLRLKEAFQNLTSLLNRDFDTSYVVGEIYKITFSILLFCSSAMARMADFTNSSLSPLMDPEVSTQMINGPDCSSTISFPCIFISLMRC